MNTSGPAGYTYQYPHSAVATDIMVLTVAQGELQTLLIKRGEKPHKGRWALPGGFLRMDETIERCASRELAEETGVTNVPVFQCGIFSDPKRDPRERVMSVAYFSLVRQSDVELEAGTDAADARWFPMSELPTLAFDHAKIVEQGLATLKERSDREPLAALVLAERFTMSEFQEAAESVTGRTFERRNFRRLKVEAGWVVASGQQRTGNHPPADLYELGDVWKERYLPPVD